MKSRRADSRGAAVLRTILVPHDFSSHAQAAWARAEQLAWGSRATLHLLHVVQTPFLHALTPFGVVPFSMGPVVMGSSGRRGLARALLGSVTERTQRCAPCPVLAVRAGSKGVEWDE